MIKNAQRTREPCRSSYGINLLNKMHNASSYRDEEVFFFLFTLAEWGVWNLFRPSPPLSMPRPCATLHLTMRKN